MISNRLVEWPLCLPAILKQRCNIWHKNVFARDSLVSPVRGSLHFYVPHSPFPFLDLATTMKLCNFMLLLNIDFFFCNAK